MIFTNRTERYVGTLPVEREYDLHQSLAHRRHRVRPQRENEDLLLGESQEEEEETVVRAECGHQQTEVSPGPEERD